MTKFSRRQAATLMAGAIVAPFAAPAIVSARSSQTIFIIVPYASGGSIDSLMRSIAKGMSEALDQPVLLLHREQDDRPRRVLAHLGDQRIVRV